MLNRLAHLSISSSGRQHFPNGLGYHKSRRFQQLKYRRDGMPDGILLKEQILPIMSWTNSNLHGREGRS